jgi:hypothetical protein
LVPHQTAAAHEDYDIFFAAIGIALSPLLPPCPAENKRRMKILDGTCLPAVTLYFGIEK